MIAAGLAAYAYGASGLSREHGMGDLFDGRVSEDFKLNTGTWVNLASVKGAIIRAFAPQAIHISTEGPLGMAARRW